ncbi:glycosyltransferase family 9 protein [Curtobacterium sp. MCBD17_013]|uniref:glycosyltransferase family 9 protein n=1 Tax=Curtobacterium sp. MCBD17_013 TaxID=2175668 RepID=UPI0021ABC443|nr:glycosyltransferase family 9 protein [Curtobacterium sp. MCBD17_013]
MFPIGQAQPAFEDVREIAVLRGGGLGDLLFAMPAIDALAAAYPEARITLLGTPMAAALLADRPSSIDAVEVLPVAPGVREVAGQESDPAEVDAFTARLHGRFDLAVQVHGGGRNSNPFLLRLGARHTVGTATEDAEVLERWVRYVYYQHEVLRALEVAGLAGAAPVVLDPVVHVSDDERAAAVARIEDAIGAPLAGRRIVAVHPGATDPRRRWPEERFAAVAAARMAQGDVVIVVGDESDREAAITIARSATDIAGPDSPGQIVDLAGVLGLGELPGTLAIADVMVADDSGPRHLAVAVGTRTVGIFWFGNVVNAAPFDRGRHRVEMSFTTHCPVCGVDVTQVGWTAERCEHDPSFVAEVGVEVVLADVADLLATAPDHAAAVSAAARATRGG